MRVMICQIKRSWVTKINSILIRSTEDVDIVMPMYNLLEHSDHYSMISGSLWNYCRNEVNGDNEDAYDGKSFKYKTKYRKNMSKPCTRWSSSRHQSITTRSSAAPNLNTEVTFPLQYLVSFWRLLNLSLINCKF